MDWIVCDQKLKVLQGYVIYCRNKWCSGDNGHDILRKRGVLPGIDGSCRGPCSSICKHFELSIAYSNRQDCRKFGRQVLPVMWEMME